MKRSEFVERIASSVEQYLQTCQKSYSVASSIALEQGLPVSESDEDPIIQAIMTIYRMYRMGLMGGATGTVRVFCILEKAWEGYQEQQKEAEMVGGGGG